jgi:anti-sigma factor RsiW
VSRCLGPRIADLADGRLEPAEAERGFAHVAVCPTCRAALTAQRAVRSRLDTVGQVDPPSDLLGRLRGIAEPGVEPVPPIPTQGGAGFRPGGAAGRRPGGASSGSTRPPTQGRRVQIVAAGAAGAAALALAVVVGGSSALTSTVVTRPSIAPVVDTFTAEHAVSAGLMPLSGPRIVTVGYVGPAAPDQARPAPTP